MRIMLDSAVFHMELATTKNQVVKKSWNKVRTNGV